MSGLIPRWRMLGVVCVLVLGATGCSRDFVTGEYTFNLYDESAEIQMGRDADPQIVAEYGLYEDEALAVWVAGLGQSVARVSQRPQLTYTVRLLDSPVVNAFALPGGWVYMTRGILAHFNSEDELVGVLGHEVGHVVARHGVEQMSRQAVAGAGVGLLQQLHVPLIGDLAGASAGLLFLKFSRGQESESDRLGVEYSTRLGYDAHRMAEFFKTLARMSGGSSGALPSFLSTHPDPGDREVTVHALTDEWRTKVDYSPKNTDRGEYFKRIEGIVYGNDPRQGFVEDGVFYHPQLKFQFAVPEGWLLQNTPSVVQIMDTKTEKAVISFSIVPEKNAAAATDSFVARGGARVINREATRVNGVPAVVLESQMNNPNVDVRALSYFIARDGRVYAFHGLTYAETWPDYVAGFRATMTSFAPVTNPRVLAVKPDRIRLARVEAAGDVQTVLSGLGFGGERLSELALLNGRSLTDRVEKGTWLKIIGK